MNTKPVGILILMLSVVGCQPSVDSLKTYGAVKLPDTTAEVPLTQFGGKWTGHWTNGESGTITIAGGDSSALEVKYCYASYPCKDIEDAEFEGGTIRWSDGSGHYTFWLEGDDLRGVLKEYSKERWWTLYAWMERV